MSTYKIIYKDFELEYKLFGSGSGYMLAFHGVGRSADDFKIFENTLGKKYTIVAVNLFYHGNSLYPKDRMFHNQITKKELIELIEALLLKLNINRFSLMGYSLGGRFSFTIAQFLHKRIDRLILIAPDGLTKMTYNKFTTETNVGKKFVQFMIRRPVAFFKIINFLHQYKIIPNRQKKLITAHLETHERRLLLRNVISSFKYIVPNLKKVIENINSENIDITMIFGKYDFIIPVKLGEDFLKNITSNKKLHLINSSHNILTENASKTLSELIE